MPVFKVTLLVSDGLSLGSVLMTNNVQLLHIQEVEEHAKYMGKTHIEHDTKLLLSEKKKYKESIDHFRHPSGKRTMDFALEFFAKQPNKTAKWRELANHVAEQGFHKSSINNCISRLLKAGTIKREGPGLYKLVK
jgi:hypothetical protein